MTSVSGTDNELSFISPIRLPEGQKHPDTSGTVGTSQADVRIRITRLHHSSLRASELETPKRPLMDPRGRGVDTLRSDINSIYRMIVSSFIIALVFSVHVTGLPALK